MSEEIVWWKPSDNVMQRQKSTAPTEQKRPSPTVWTNDMLRKLRREYPTRYNAELARELGLKMGTVKNKAYKLGLRKSAEHIREATAKGQFKPGQQSHTKGKKMSPEVYAKVKRTMFRKGHTSGRTLYDGATVIRKGDKEGTRYRYIRVALRKWQEYYRYVWEQAHGPIPEGGVIRHINGDTLDDRLENLELLTKQENMVRNSASLNLSDNFVANALAWHDPEGKAAVLKHPELIELKRAQLKLNRAIKSKTPKT